MKNWDDARYVLAVARAHSHSAAATSLGVNQTTVSRRLERLERETGLTLFALINGRIRPTVAGTAIVEECARLEAAVAALDQRTQSLSNRPVYRVTLAATETVARTLLAPNVRSFCDSNPDIRLTLTTGHQNIRLDQGDADLAVRLNRPRAGRFRVRKLSDLEFAVYGAKSGGGGREYDTWLGYTPDMSHLPEARWMSEHMAGADKILQSNDIASLAEAAASGAGLAMLPRRLGDAHPRLRRMAPAKAPVSREAWLMIREGLHQYGHIRAVADWVVDVFSAPKSATR